MPSFHFLYRPVLAGIVILCLFWAKASAGTAAPDPEPATGWQNKEAASAKRFMAVTAHPLATEAASVVLKKGGTAVDAAVTAQLVLNLVEPQSSGIGGGAFMLYWDAGNQTLLSFDGRETAPAAVESDYFKDAGGQIRKWRQARLGARAVGVPGTLHLLHTAHQQFGSQPWESLFTPAITLSRTGFSVSPRMAKSIKGAQEYLRRFEETREYFFTEQGDPLPAGHHLKNPAFADTLETIAKEGIAPFYEGVIGAKLIEALQGTSAMPALMTAQDLAEYRTLSRPPVCAGYHGNAVCGMGPPSSGALTVGQILRLVERFDIGSLGPGAESIHLILEASRLAFADRARYMADSDFVPVPVEGLLNADYLRARSQLIQPEASIGEALPGHPPGITTAQASMHQIEPAGTSHFSIVDSRGNIVSMTTTIESGFGSMLMTQGFVLNNEMTDFSFRASKEGRPVANRVEGGKRPRSSMAPTIVFNSGGAPVLVAGSPGGSRIICYVAQALIGVLDWEMNPQQAVSMPHFCNRNGATDLEPHHDAKTLETALTGLGHEVRIRDMNSGLHMIQLLPSGQLLGGADPRREGRILGE
ncbi:MAG: gamma-glutamyltransferase [Arenicellales bacterium]|jgi:gamma-glutamyltranspeptidase/glutathione hydrolase|nr:gamma-glutamyltransferase [Arenicellales bacterium]MDP6552753.1 gamma-glutamyltransferase [Arenicellales bacterium]MDP6791097.1 gamma-glutamyltransferase [Arenicellales bacterium]MDP6918903.1 gamma-glutamyltransferase [Arenicellales bacterium]|tara:strand:+ start:2812 stop:4572 length:1761 start_codon:yes stop_codon:yes gene_type:complete